MSMETNTESLPALLVEAFEGDRELLEWTLALSSSTRKDIARWVMDPVSLPARIGRAEQLAERLLMTLEAEKELPPRIAGALGRTAGARKGWEAMTAIQRRNHLLAVFGPKSEEGRQRQLQKLLEACVDRARGTNA